MLSNWFSSADRVLAILGLTGSVVFGLISVVQYLRSRQLRRLDALWAVSTLQSKRHHDVRILFRDRDIDDLSRLRVLFVNSGTLPIRPSTDFPAQFKGGVTLRRKGEATQFLSAAALAGDLASCGATASVTEEGVVSVTFEYMNPDQRIGVEVLYTGSVPEIAAELIGGSVRLSRGRSVTWWALLVDEFAPLFVIAAVVLPAAYLFYKVSQSGIPFAWLLGSAVAISLVGAELWLGFRYLLPARRRSYRAKSARLGFDFLLGI